MGEHRELVDLRMMKQMNSHAIVPLLLSLGARYLVKPYIGKYDDENKTARWGYGHKHHGDKRHRSSGAYEGIHYADGETDEGRTREVVLERRLAWAAKQDNRLAQNREHINTKKVSFEETYNEIRTFSSMDLIQRFSASAQGEVLGIGGSVSSSTEARGHTELETNQFNRHKEEVIIDCSADLLYPGPILDDAGRVIEEGNIWLIERFLETIQTVTPITQWGIWDARIVLDIEDWAGNYGPMPRGEHDNKLEFSGINELISFMQKDLVLRYKWLPNLKLNDAAKKGLDWLRNEENRRVGPVEWARVRLNENVGALEPSIVMP